MGILATLGRGMAVLLNRSSQWVALGLAGYVTLAIVLLHVGLALNVTGLRGINVAFAIFWGISGILFLLIPWVATVIALTQQGLRIIGINLQLFRAFLLVAMTGTVLFAVLSIVPFETAWWVFELFLLAGLLLTFVATLASWGGNGYLIFVATFALIMFGYGAVLILVGPAEHTESAEAASELLSDRERDFDQRLAEFIRGISRDSSKPLSPDEREILRLAEMRKREETVGNRALEAGEEFLGTRGTMEILHTVAFGKTERYSLPKGKWKVHLIPHGREIYRFRCSDGSGATANVRNSQTGTIRVNGARDGETFISTGTVVIGNDHVSNKPGCTVTEPITVTIQLIPKLW